MNEQLKNNWDKIVLVAASVLALACCGYFIFRSLTFSKQFDAPAIAPVNKLKETEVTALESAATLYREPAKWVKPDGGWSLFRSVPIVLDPEGSARRIEADGPPVLPPLSNAYILKHGLDITSPDLLGQDGDEDGFTNEEEFTGGETNPNDKASKPPIYTKLCLVELMPSDHTLIFEVKAGANQYQIKRIRKTGGADETKNFWVREGESFDEGNRFRLDRYEFVERENPRTQVKEDVSLVTITDTGAGAGQDQTWELERKKPFPLPTFTGIFRNELAPGDGDFKKKEGESITLSNDPDKTPYKVLQVTEDEAVIESPDGESITVSKCP